MRKRRPPHRNIILCRESSLKVDQVAGSPQQDYLSLRRCLLHFGLHKTGSSPIQGFLSSHTLPGIIYPDLGEANQSRPLATAFSSDPTEYQLNRTAKLDPSAVEQRGNETRLSLDKAFASHEASRIVLSAEDLSLSTEEDLADFVGFLAQRAGEIKGLAYIRTVSGWLESLFQETLRNSNRLPPPHALPPTLPSTPGKVRSVARLLEYRSGGVRKRATPRRLCGA
jgi:hypothetical protein